MTMFMDIKDILPTQLFIEESKLKDMTIECCSLPLPVKTFGKIFFTDGHTRAFFLHKQGVGKIEVYEDKDDLNWFEYVVCLGWCRSEDIVSIRDLEERILGEEEYEEKWLERCDRMHKAVKADPLSFTEIRYEDDTDMAARTADSILRSLPGWFGIDDAICDYVKKVPEMKTLIARIEGFPAGFITIKEHFNSNAEIYVMGVYVEFHRMGIGTTMVKRVEEHYRSAGYACLTVKTLSPAREDSGYEATRKFYEKNGFVPFEEFPELWDKSNPCRMYIKYLT